MKLLFSLLLTLSLSAAFANNGIKITSGKNTSLQVNFQSSLKKQSDAVVTVRDAKGNIISQKNTTAVFGENNFSLGNAAEMNEGNYTVEVKLGDQTLTANFTVWK